MSDFTPAPDGATRDPGIMGLATHLSKDHDAMAQFFEETGFARPATSPIGQMVDKASGYPVALGNRFLAWVWWSHWTDDPDFKPVILMGEE